MKYFYRVNTYDQHQSRDMGNADSKIKEATEKAEKIALEKEKLKEVYEKTLTQKEEESKQKLQDLERKLQTSLTTKENEIQNKVEAAKKEQILRDKSELAKHDKLKDEETQKLLTKKELEMNRRIQELVDKKEREKEKLKESYEAELKKTEENCQAEIQRKREGFEAESKRKELENESLLEKERQKSVDFQDDLIKKQQSKELELESKQKELAVTERDLEDKLSVIDKWKKEVESEREMKEREANFREFRTRYL